MQTYDREMAQFEADNEDTNNRSFGGLDGVERDRDPDIEMEEGRLAEYDAERGRQTNDTETIQAEHGNGNGTGGGFTAVNG